MCSRRWIAGGGVGFLKQRVRGIVNLGYGYGGRLHPFHLTLLGLRDIAEESGGRGGVDSPSVMLSEFRRGICSSTWVSSPADSNGSFNLSGNGSLKNCNGTEESISLCEAKKIMRLVNLESLKMKLGMEGKEVISYSQLLQACKSVGIARNSDEATAFAKVLDDAGVIILFRDKVYLHPDKVVDLVRRAVPLALTADVDPVRDELKKLQEKKEEIDVLAHKQVRRILWSGLGLAVVQVGLFFRLTFWEFSWDVMEPIAFFGTATGLVIGYAYFLLTSRDPTYQDLMKRLFLSRQRKLIKRHDFDVERFMQLQKLCKSPLHARTTLRNRLGVELDLEDALHMD